MNNIICGDAYLLDGQSNTVADNKGGKHGMFKSEWIRSFGGMGGGSQQGFGNAVASSASGDAYRIGYWGVALADLLGNRPQDPHLHDQRRRRRHPDRPAPAE